MRISHARVRNSGRAKRVEEAEGSAAPWSSHDATSKFPMATRAMANRFLVALFRLRICAHTICTRKCIWIKYKHKQPLVKHNTLENFSLASAWCFSGCPFPAGGIRASHTQILTQSIWYFPGAHLPALFFAVTAGSTIPAGGGRRPPASGRYHSSNTRYRPRNTNKRSRDYLRAGLLSHPEKHPGSSYVTHARDSFPLTLRRTAYILLGKCTFT